MQLQRTVIQLLRSAVVASVAVLLHTQATAQIFTTLHDFAGGNDGTVPTSGLVLSGNSLYGSTVEGGSSGSGTVFKVNTDGTGLVILYNFTAVSGYGTNSDGGAPYAGVIVSSNVLYGTSRVGGSSGGGTVFKVNTDGTGFATLYSFGEIATNPPYGYDDGYDPLAPLTLSGTTLYGTAHYGGAHGNGTVFKINTDGTGFTAIKHFSDLSIGSPYTNLDGASPTGGLVVSGGAVYGTAFFGGANGNGTVFKVNTDGTGFTTLYSFSPGYINADGASPYAGLILSSNTLYGTAFDGGQWNSGTIFKLNTDGSGFSNLHSFSGLNTNLANGDGFNPYAGLILSSNTLYGTANQGGTSGNGTLFKINIDGTDFGSLYSFTRPARDSSTNADGALPIGGLVFSGNTLYGTASAGGGEGGGTIFSLVLTPQLTMRWIPAGPHVRLLWSTNATGYNLQASPDLSSWTNVSPAPVISAGQNAVTQPILGTRLFYRLSQP
jgi:uncharacterized repeat protein (TIGR03803 family)